MRDSSTGVREAGRDELEPLSATLADAFVADPILQWLVPGRRGRGARLRGLFAIELEHYVLPAGRVLTTEGLGGASLELGPGNWKMPGVPLSGAVRLLRVFGRRLPRAVRTQQYFERTHLQEPHYYVRYVGVSTRFQGQGLGSALLRPTLDRSDAESVPAYLEASSVRSAQLYERLGFVHLGEQRLPDGPPYWPMRRAPRDG